ncbi:MAG: hypothetical protein HYV45_00330 [Candidatus Moranbacteria bacterium]|nr:hypothetical protein [Candidatus Moranbacteria bacterium]
MSQPVTALMSLFVPPAGMGHCFDNEEPMTVPWGGRIAQSPHFFQEEDETDGDWNDDGKFDQKRSKPSPFFIDRTLPPLIEEGEECPHRSQCHLEAQTGALNQKTLVRRGKILCQGC